MEGNQQELRNEIINNLKEQGLTQSQIAKAVNLSPGRVSQILKLIKAAGGEIPRPTYKGAQMKLTDSQIEQLETLLDQGAEANGFEGDIWTGKRVSTLIKVHYKVSYHPNHIPKLLRSLGYSLQKPKTEDFRKDPSEVEKWKKERLPAIKKSS